MTDNTLQRKEVVDCLFCKSEIAPGAVKCLHCFADLSVVSPKHGGTCPLCKSTIHIQALRCKYCKSWTVPRTERAPATRQVSTRVLHAPSTVQTRHPDDDVGGEWGSGSDAEYGGSQNVYTEESGVGAGGWIYGEDKPGPQDQPQNQPQTNTGSREDWHCEDVYDWSTFNQSKMTVGIYRVCRETYSGRTTRAFLGWDHVSRWQAAKRPKYPPNEA
jgi:hypothetical protein